MNKVLVKIIFQTWKSSVEQTSLWYCTIAMLPRRTDSSGKTHEEEKRRTNINPWFIIDILVSSYDCLQCNKTLCACSHRIRIMNFYGPDLVLVCELYSFGDCVTVRLSAVLQRQRLREKKKRLCRVASRVITLLQSGWVKLLVTMRKVELLNLTYLCVCL